MCIAQNGPGITNFVTAVAAAYWNHTPMIIVTPETGAKTQGLGGFQETRQLPYFEEITCHQETLAHPARMVESLNRCFQRARQHSAPVQFNIPRDYFCQVIDVEIPDPILPGRQPRRRGHRRRRRCAAAATRSTRSSWPGPGWC